MVREARLGQALGLGAAGGDREIFLCLNDQGGRGEHGAWLSIWCDDASAVDRLHTTCKEEGFEVVDPPEDKPWGVREMHLRHPDGHVLRISSDSPHDH